MNIVLYYLVLLGALLGSIYYLSRGLKSLSAVRNKGEGVLVAKTKVFRNIAIGIFGTVLWLTVIIVSICNQLSSLSK
jgi:hypothetical protein